MPGEISNIHLFILRKLQTYWRGKGGESKKIGDWPHKAAQDPFLRKDVRLVEMVELGSGQT